VSEVLIDWGDGGHFQPFLEESVGFEILCVVDFFV
jgi:hypothetical protein